MTGIPILDPTSPHLFRVQRGLRGADFMMAPDVGTGGRYAITTGEAPLVNGGTEALTHGWRNAFNPQQPGFAVIVLFALLLLIHAHFEFGAGWKLGAGARR